MGEVCLEFLDVSFDLIDEALKKEWIADVVKMEGGKLGVLTFVFCNDKHLLSLNRKYLNSSYLTDVIAFDYGNKDIVEGDVYISLERVVDNAVKFNVEAFHEISRVMVHGTLHLLGYTDKTIEEKSSMALIEDKYLSLHPILIK